MISKIRAFALSMIAALMALAAAPAANATTVVYNVDWFNTTGYYGGSAYVPATPDGSQLKFTVDYKGLTVTNAYISQFVSIDMHRWDTALNMEVGNSIPTQNDCNWPTCLVQTGPYQLVGAVYVPKSWSQPSCTAATIGYCSITYTAPFGNYSHADFYFTLDGSGDTPWAQVTYEITAVPEPGVWALLIAGFGLAGAALRRRPRGLAA